MKEAGFVPDPSAKERRVVILEKLLGPENHEGR